MADAAPARARMTVLAHEMRPAVPRRIAIHVSDVALPVSIALWAIGVSQTHATSLGALGLPAALPVVFYAGVVLLVLSALVESAVENSSPLRMGLHAAGLVVMLYGTGALVYPEGRYSWLYKTIGVVQYVNAHGQLDRTIDIYQNWPGFFALAAWFDKVAGVSSPLVYARWAQVVFELAALPLLYLIYDGLSLTYRQRWMALLLYPAANWIGQDYFSPQALGTVLSLGIMALTMRYAFTGNQTWGRPRRRWLKRKRLTEPAQAAVSVKPRGRLPRALQRLAHTPQAGWNRLRWAARRLGLDRAWAVLRREQAETSGAPQDADKTLQPNAALTLRARLLLAPLAQADGYANHADRPIGQEPVKRAAPLADLAVRPGRRSPFLVTILLLFFALTSIHELSPYIVALQLMVLAAARPLRPRWLPLALLAIAVAYLLPRLSFVNSHYGLLGSFGSFFGNAAPPSSSSSSYAGSIPASQLLIQHCADALSVLMWLLALVGAWRLRHSGRIVLALLVLTFSPILVLFGQAYGNEGLLRVYLFSLPWAAALAAAAVAPGPLARTTLPRLRAAAAAAAVRLATAGQATLRRLRTASVATAATLGTLTRAMWSRMRRWDAADVARARAMARRLRARAAAIAAVEWGPLARTTVQQVRTWPATVAAVRPSPVSREIVQRLRGWGAAIAAAEWGTMARAAGRRLHGPWVAVLVPVAVRLGTSAGAAGRRLRAWAVALTAAAVPLGSMTRAVVQRLRAAIRSFNSSWIMAAVRWVRAPVALCVVIGMFLIAFYGDDAFDTFSTSEVNTVYSFLLHARPGALYVAEDNVPADDTAEYYLFPGAVVFGARSGAPVVDKPTANVATLIAENSVIYTDDGKTPAYVVITPSMVPYNNAYKQAPGNSFAILQKSLASSKQWKLVVNRDGTIIYELPARTGS